MIRTGIASLLLLSTVLLAGVVVVGYWGPKSVVETEDGLPLWVSYTDRVRMMTSSLRRGANPFAACPSALGPRLTPPLAGETVLGFGPTLHPSSNRLRHHAGVDFERPAGTPVLASAAGRVSFAHRAGYYGNLIIVTHEGSVETLYAHLSTALARFGQCVNAGDVLGLVGSTGLSNTPHLHFEIRKNGVAQDPQLWFSRKTID